MAVPTNISLVDLNAHARRMLVVEVDVTGTETVSTGLTEVEQVWAVLDVAPSVNAMWVVATIDTQATYPGRITLTVTKPTANDNVTPTASSTSTAVRVLVIGQAEQDH